MSLEVLIGSAYTAFNRRDIDAALSLMHPAVDWPNGWEGGYVHGHEAIRTYWTRQWQELDPTVTPISFQPLADGRMQIGVKQVVKDLTGRLLAETMISHVYTFENGLIKKMEIMEDVIK